MKSGAPFYRYSDYMKERYGERVQKITVDAGFTCPNRDGTKGRGGCIYCNNESFSPAHKSPKSIQEQIHHFIGKLKRRYNVSKYLVYFQAYSNTYAELETLKKIYSEALSIPEVMGLSIGTRADCVDEAKLDYLGELAKKWDITVEYGLESISNESLKRINRGHSFEDFVWAIQESRKRGIKTCAHLILGFPWENEELWLKTADVLSELKVDFLKVHQLHIVKDTELARQYEKEPFKLFTVEEYRSLLIRFLERLSPDIVIQRLFGEAPPSTIVTGHWDINSGAFSQSIEETMKSLGTWQGKKCVLLEKNCSL